MKFELVSKNEDNERIAAAARDSLEAEKVQSQEAEAAMDQLRTERDRAQEDAATAQAELATAIPGLKEQLQSLTERMHSEAEASIVALQQSEAARADLQAQLRTSEEEVPAPHPSCLTLQSYHRCLVCLLTIFSTVGVAAPETEEDITV